MSLFLGKRIREIRLHCGMSQRNACKDICTQAYISKIENGDIFPSADILIKLSDRFNIDISYLADISNSPRHEYVLEVFNQLRHAIYSRNYSLVREIIKTEEKNKLFWDVKNLQFLKWHEGICLFYEDRDIEKSIFCLDTALSMTYSSRKLYSEREIEILISKGNIYTDSGSFNLAIKIYQEGINHLKHLLNITNHFVPIRLYYNYSRSLRFNKNYFESIAQCDKGLSLTKKNNLLYLKGDLYYQKAINFKAQNNDEKTIENLKLAKMVYMLENNKNSLELVNEMLQNFKT